MILFALPTIASSALVARYSLTRTAETRPDTSTFSFEPASNHSAIDDGKVCGLSEHKLQKGTLASWGRCQNLGDETWI